ncbi:MAG: WYL domain-containing protein [Vicinamibacterales bacterium]|jgi:predicted DNA-binding transcriptional regulator YafY|nr:WYL domain-containing protein [Vicinamibacterales bacterium]
MARNQEVVRQWSILRMLDANRLGVHLDTFAAETGASSRTIRRDLEALQEAGFPVYDEKTGRRTLWKVDERLFKRLQDVGLSLPELSALYLGRTMLECLVGPPFRDDVRSALEKIATVLPPTLREALDGMHGIFVAKTEPRGGASDADGRRHTQHVVNAIMDHRQLELHYDSRWSNRDKVYLVEPYRLWFADATLYLRAFVPEYGAMRTFALHRMRRVTPLERTFVPRQDLEDDPFEHSLGIYSGPPVPVVLEFSTRAAAYVAERQWHASQTTTAHADGRLTMRLRVSDDFALRTWILGFGREVRVLEPSSLAAWVKEVVEDMRAAYDGKGSPDGQALLPFEIVRASRTS